MSPTIRFMTDEDVPGVVALQRLAFPPPFSDQLHWDPEHLYRHIALFPKAQWVADIAGEVVGSCSNTLIGEAAWQAHGNWSATVGGPMLRSFTGDGTTLYGLDIAVHPEHRRQGIGRGFYQRRFEFVRSNGLMRYGTACRMPGLAAYAAEHAPLETPLYARLVVSGEVEDRTLTPLLRYGLNFIGVINEYMEDPESLNAASLLEWQP